jgi:CRISPR/Cas system endoribonuclease Cas6 (RAMP superfamily)
VSDGGEHLNEAQGFLGTWEFNFKGASEATKTAVLALARYAEFAGVGRHTARGAGTVSTTVHGV